MSCLNAFKSSPTSTPGQLSTTLRIACDAQASSLSWFANQTRSAAGSAKSAARWLSLCQRKQNISPCGARWSTAQGSISYSSTSSTFLIPSFRERDVNTPVVDSGSQFKVDNCGMEPVRPGSDSITANVPPTRSFSGALVSLSLRGLTELELEGSCW